MTSVYQCAHVSTETEKRSCENESIFCRQGVSGHRSLIHSSNAWDYDNNNNTEICRAHNVIARLNLRGRLSLGGEDGGSEVRKLIK